MTTSAGSGSSRISPAKPGRWPDGAHRYTVRQELVVHECPVCGILYAFPDRLDDAALEHTRAAPGETISITCPLGHRWSYTGENAEQKLRRRLESQRDVTATVRAQRDQALASAAAHKGHTTRLKKRVAAGMCPHCNRHFKNLERHCASQHPDAS